MSRDFFQFPRWLGSRERIFYPSMPIFWSKLAFFGSFWNSVTVAKNLKKSSIFPGVQNWQLLSHCSKGSLETKKIPLSILVQVTLLMSISSPNYNILTDVSWLDIQIEQMLHKNKIFTQRVSTHAKFEPVPQFLAGACWKRLFWCLDKYFD